MNPMGVERPSETKNELDSVTPIPCSKPFAHPNSSSNLPPDRAELFQSGLIPEAYSHLFIVNPILNSCCQCYCPSWHIIKCTDTHLAERDKHHESSPSQNY